ncbi:enoyl-CoA hydratase/isomerase family protein [Arthrobacter sp. NPDC080073]|uniref:enoyl-CoA hydratase/isomerase family protein n=1 Tax=Arthrobacter sp. NPDC080073 TaxID=3155919 RepID=UPI003439B5EF
MEQRGSVPWLFLNRPTKRNALNNALTTASERQVDEVAADTDTAVVVLAGEGPGFSAGGDFRHSRVLATEYKVMFEQRRRLHRSSR